jgi:AraC-like DNA-binding protein
MLNATPMPVTTISRPAFATLLAQEHGESLFDALEDVQFWIKDAQGRYQRANRALLANYGLRDERAVIGHSDRELFPPHLADQYVQDDRLVLSGRAIRGRIELVSRPDRSTSWHVTDKIPLRGRDGRIIGTAGITRDLDGASIVGKPLGVIQPAVAHLRAQVHLPLNKRLLARLIGRSVRALERRFLSAFGMTLVAYQRQLRMQRACHLLITGEAQITHIALEVGYADHSHFSRVFRRVFNLTPRRYRQRWQRS